MSQDQRLMTGVDRRQLLKGAAAGAGALSLPRTALAQATPRKGGTLRLAMPYNPAAVDPMTGRNLPDFNVLYAVFDALIDFEPRSLELKPGLAKSWRFTDPKTLVLELAEGINFHDGTPFNAEAVKFNLERYKNDQRSNVKADVASVDSVEITGKSQVTLKLNRPNAGLPAILTNRVGLMVSPKSVQDKGGNVDRCPCRHRPVQVRELAGQRQLRSSAQRELLAAGTALPRRHQHQDHQRAEHRSAGCGCRRGRHRHQFASAAESRLPIGRRTWSASPRRRSYSTAPSSTTGARRSTTCACARR